MKNEFAVPALNFVRIIAANIDNEELSDTDFREFVRNTLPIVQKEEKETKLR